MTIPNEKDLIGLPSALRWQALRKLNQEIFDVGSYIQFEENDDDDDDDDDDDNDNDDDDGDDNGDDKNNKHKHKSRTIDTDQSNNLNNNSTVLSLRLSIDKLVSLLPRKYNVIATDHIKAHSQVFLIDHMW